MVAEPNAQYDPAFGHQVNHGHIFSQMHGVVIRRLQNKGAKINPLGARGIAGQHDQGWWEHGLGAVVPLGQEDAVKAGLLGLNALVQQLVAELRGCLGRGLGLIIRTAVGVGHITDFHRSGLSSE